MILQLTTEDVLDLILCVAQYILNDVLSDVDVMCTSCVVLAAGIAMTSSLYVLICVHLQQLSTWSLC